VVGSEGFDTPADLVERQVVELRVDQQRLVPLTVEQRGGVTVLERQVRLAAPEVDAAVERPVRVDEREPHDALLATATAGAVPDSLNQDASACTPSRTDVRGRQPVSC
jgi:hypothetical protein